MWKRATSPGDLLEVLEDDPWRHPYLQQREFRLVYENLAERQRLLDNAPHLVSPLPFLIPLFGRDGVVSKAVARSYASALWMYDLTGGWRIGHRHREVTKEGATLENVDLDNVTQDGNHGNEGPAEGESPTEYVNAFTYNTNMVPAGPRAMPPTA